MRFKNQPASKNFYVDPLYEVTSQLGDYYRSVLPDTVPGLPVQGYEPGLARAWEMQRVFEAMQAQKQGGVIPMMFDPSEKPRMPSHVPFKLQRR